MLFRSIRDANVEREELYGMSLIEFVRDVCTLSSVELCLSSAKAGPNLGVGMNGTDFLDFNIKS